MNLLETLTRDRGTDSHLSIFILIVCQIHLESNLSTKENNNSYLTIHISNLLEITGYSLMKYSISIDYLCKKTM